MNEDDGWLYADNAEHSASSKETLNGMDIQDWTSAGARRNTPRTEKQQHSNAAKRKIRVRVEHVCGYIEFNL